MCAKNVDLSRTQRFPSKYSLAFVAIVIFLRKRQRRRTKYSLTADIRGMKMSYSSEEVNIGSTVPEYVDIYLDSSQHFFP